MAKSAGAAGKEQEKASTAKAGKKLQKPPNRTSPRKLSGQPPSQETDSETPGEGEMGATLSPTTSPASPSKG